MARQRINTRNMGFPSSQTRILGGVEVDPACPDCKYPFMVSIKANQHFCGGVLIDERWVLTAAHCADNISPSTKFELGLHNVNYTPGRQTYYSNYDVIIHPDYEDLTSDPNIGVIYNDYALIYLNEPVDNIFTPIPLITDDLYDNDGNITTIMGWGKTEEGISSDVLLEVDVPIDDSCGSWNIEDFTENHICLGTGLPPGSIFGCAHPDACNYNPDATIEDGSCIFDCECDLFCVNESNEEVLSGWCCEDWVDDGTMGNNPCVYIPNWTDGSGQEAAHNWASMECRNERCNGQDCVLWCQSIWKTEGDGCGVFYSGDDWYWEATCYDWNDTCDEAGMTPDGYEAEEVPYLGSGVGDSGGPAIIINPQNGQYELIGITSFGRIFNNPLYPSVYARIFYEKDWILDTISNPPEDYDIDPYIPGEPLDIEYNNGDFIDENDTVLDVPLQVRGDDAIIQNWFDGMTTLTLRQLLGKEIYITLDNPG